MIINNSGAIGHYTNVNHATHCIPYPEKKHKTKGKKEGKFFNPLGN